ncbi:MAG TPA: tetratricopeptide repeat protein [Gammaproteobacteria bacterium]|jgi:tetratricopeptide (TPR) repeat protein|nr:tetratricopeptide repeat protein [Gammaproteobacteria bacterium]
MKHAPLWLLAACLTGCATVPAADDGDRQIEVDSHLLAGDIAFERQDFTTAADELLAAAMTSDQPAVAERAARMAHQLDLTDVGLKAAARWRELNPDDERAAWFAGVFETRANHLPKAIAEFEDFIRATDDPPSGFALVLEALVDEPYPRAATAIMQALNRTFPDVPAGQYSLARLALRSGDFDIALTNAEAASKSNPDWLEAQLLYSRALLVAGRTDDGLGLAQRLAEQHKDLEVQLQYAELLLSAGKPREAEKRLNDILATNPGLPEATRALAFLAMTEQRIDDAKRYFNELRGEMRYRSEAFYYLGRLAETEKDLLTATRSYARVTDGTHAVEAQARTARIMLDQGDGEGALRHLRDFGEANPRFASDMLVAQAQLLLQMKQPDAAMKLFDESLAARPDDPALRAAHVQLYVILAQDAQQRGAYDEAERLLEQGLARYAGNSSLRYTLALVYEDQGKNRKAVDVLENLVAQSPDDPALLNALGYLLTDQFGRHQEARGYIQRALAMSPDSAAIIDSMGWVLYKLGDYRAAADYLERAYRLEPEPEIASHLVAVRWRLGQHDSARELLEQALKQSPDDRHLKEVGAQLHE